MRYLGRMSSDAANAFINAALDAETLDESVLQQLFRDTASSTGKHLRKSDILAALPSRDEAHPRLQQLRKLCTKKPVRSLSGITSVTILTKPFPCPGKCIFCPVDVRMPKSYIATEPGAMRAAKHGFDPYTQVTTRLASYTNTGHPIAKIELIVLGGTWSAYPEEYQRWFLKRAIQALNDFGTRDDSQGHAYIVDDTDRLIPGETYDAHINRSHFVQDPFDETATWEQLLHEQATNATAKVRCVGLSLETRPDLVTTEEATQLRRLGATKIQIGLQSLDDAVLKANKRGHTVAQSQAALTLLRSFGFKLHVHWMPNLLGSTPQRDQEDYDRLFADPAIRPDELKVYPCVLTEGTELQARAAQGEWTAYTEDDLAAVLRYALIATPEYCRLTRVVRDIPSFEILAGNKRGNLRQMVTQELLQDDATLRDIRAREPSGRQLDPASLQLEALSYATTAGTELFLQFVESETRTIGGFARLFLPTLPAESPCPELAESAILREVHIYGQSLPLGRRAQDGSDTSPQHQGMGRQLIAEASRLAKEAGFATLSVISAMGTREYYANLGFDLGELYQHLPLEGLPE